MAALSQKEIRDRAIRFVHEWKGETREKAEAQSFWNDFFDVFGITRRRVATFEHPVTTLDHSTGAIDLFWKGTLIVEHKSKGKSLQKAYSQALDYFAGLPEQHLPKFVLVSDFEQFRLYDLDQGEHYDFSLEEFPTHTHLFSFISGYRRFSYNEEDPVNIKVAQRMGDLHDTLKASGYVGHFLETLLVRLVYCLFADDTGIWPKDHFHYLIDTRSAPSGADTGALLANIFQVLNTPEEDRQLTLDEDLAQLPYVNGSLFAEAIGIPQFDHQMRTILLDCCAFDWSRVSPAIFGSMFQSVMDPVLRHDLGGHYTSERNIMKVVSALFLDELQVEFDQSKNSSTKLRRLHDRIASLRFLDPACGCGNFLIISYRELRLLETSILRRLRELSQRTAHQLVTDVALVSRIDVDAMSGIEIEEFPARIAEVAMWVTDHQMNTALSAEFGLSLLRLPLRASPGIRIGNALRLEWESMLPEDALDSPNVHLYILGNPPFVAKHNRTAEQSHDMDIACADLPHRGSLDYVAAWYVKAARLCAGKTPKVAFVSTNSITQGEQVPALWPYLLQKGMKIHFAHRTFKWSNEAPGKASVHCVIIGFAGWDAPAKRLFDYPSPTGDPLELRPANISPYLVDAQDMVVSPRSTPISDVPPILYGSKPVDDGALLLSAKERAELLDKEPSSAKFIRPLVSAREFISAEPRYCLWLGDASPDELRALPSVHDRIEHVRQFRLKSHKASTRALAQTPYLFGEVRQPSAQYVVIPLHTSETRLYVPMGFLPAENILHNSCSAVEGATLYHLGVLSSAMHMAWMRHVCGRIKSDYRYSNSLVYNNFPWPSSPTPAMRRDVEEAAQSVLAARALFPAASLADLYDPISMPRPLLDGHRRLDNCVDACYRVKFASEIGRLAHLSVLYAQATQPLIGPNRTRTRRGTTVPPTQRARRRTTR
jgi:hypothetical protein